MSNDRKVRVVLQARTGSVRLPAKSLLPVGGYPLAVLCAKRLAHDGLEVVVATSRGSQDDLLAQIFAEAGVPVVRGSLTDVLSRFVHASSDMDTEDLVVRVTGDNPVPDAAFIRLVIDAHLASGAPYSGTASPGDGLPYGLSAEVMTVGALREADKQTTDLESRAHVTPWLRARYPDPVLTNRSLGLPDKSRWRCTVDTLRDYLRVVDLFDRSDAVELPWDVIVARLPEGHRCEGTDPCSFLALGTAHFGLDYGINNAGGKPSREGVLHIVGQALDAGVRWFDTAAAYGDAEERLGWAFEAAGAANVAIVTKVPAQSGGGQLSPTGSAYRSLHRLGVSRLDALLLHNFEDLRVDGGRHWNALAELKEQRVTSAIGVSVYDPDEALAALEEPLLGHIQVPVNVADHRWLRPSIAAAFRRRPDVTVHARSVFLQGLLLGEGAGWPLPDGEGMEILSALDELVMEMDCGSRIDLCLAWVRSIEWVDSAVIGVESVEQLNASLDGCGRLHLSSDHQKRIQERIGDVPPRLVDPRGWPNA